MPASARESQKHVSHNRTNLVWTRFAHFQHRLKSVIDAAIKDKIEGAADRIGVNAACKRFLAMFRVINLLDLFSRFLGTFF